MSYSSTEREDHKASQANTDGHDYWNAIVGMFRQELLGIHVHGAAADRDRVWNLTVERNGRVEDGHGINGVLSGSY